jgi:hypothetical protein
MNTIHTLHLRPLGGIYVFSDPRFGLVDEPFVQAANTMLDELAMRHGLRPQEPFTLLAADIPFPGSHAYPFVRAEHGGWIYCDRAAPYGSLYFWLCPALLHYFPSPPPVLYASAVSAAAAVPPAVSTAAPAA